MVDRIVPDNLGYRSGLEPLSSVWRIEGHMRVGLTGEQRQEECDTPNAKDEASPRNHRGIVDSSVLLLGAILNQHIFDQHNTRRMCSGFPKGFFTIIGPTLLPPGNS